MKITRKGFYTIKGPDGVLLTKSDGSTRQVTSRDEAYERITEDGREGTFTIHCPDREIDMPKVGTGGVSEQRLSTTGGTPSLSWSLTSTANGSTLTIETNGDNNFGTKTNAKPLLVWKADDNTTAANLTLGRASWNADPTSGSFVTDVVAPSAARSYKTDLLREPNVLGRHTHATDFSTALYCYRHSYKDYNPRTRYACRLRCDYPSTMTLIDGDEITGDVSGTTAKVAYAKPYTSGQHDIFCESDFGTFGASGATPGTLVPFLNGEGITGPSGRVATANGTYDGTSYTACSYWGFNMKGFRPHSSFGANIKPDFYYGATSSNAGSLDTMNHVPYTQVTDDVVEAGHWNGSSYDAQVTSTGSKAFAEEGAWSSEEIFILPSALDTADGEFKVWIDGHLLHVGTNWRTHVTSGEEVDVMPEWNIQNGCAEGSFAYDNYYYLDDEVERVMLVNANHVNIDQTSNGDLDLIPLPPSAWSTTSITCTYFNYMPNWTHIVIVKGDQTQLVVAR